MTADAIADSDPVGSAAEPPTREHEEAAMRRDPRPERDDERPTRFLRGWPPALWLLVYVGSVFLLNGSHGKWDPLELALGLGLATVACALALYLALGPWPGRPRPRGSGLLVGGIALFYGVCALAAALFAGPTAAIATLLAGIIPMTAAALWVATVRAKRRPGATAREPAAHDDTPFPGVGPDDRTPLGATSEAHDELSPHDLPRDHPARKGLEREGQDDGARVRHRARSRDR
jgi:hypothetical protein